MDITTNRRKRLKEWFSNQTLPAKEKSYISQLINGPASFGEKAARRLEQTYGMGLGYLDVPTSSHEMQEANAPYGREIRAEQSFVTLPAHALHIVNISDVEAYLGGDMAVVTSTIFVTETERSSFVVQIDIADDTMAEEFPPGCLVVVKPTSEAKSGQYVLAKLTPTSPPTLKQLFVDAGQVYLKPLNTRYRVLEAPEAQIVGVVIQQLTVKRYE